jgi:hypothetical protein
MANQLGFFERLATVPYTEEHSFSRCLAHIIHLEASGLQKALLEATATLGENYISFR